MGPRFLKDNEGWSFPSDFGFSGSNEGNVEARNQPIHRDNDQQDNGTYLGQPKHLPHMTGDNDVRSRSYQQPNHKNSPRFADGGSVSFANAFRAARAFGDAQFTWNGRRYTTQIKSEGEKLPMPPMPPARNSSNDGPGESMQTTNQSRPFSQPSNADFDNQDYTPPASIPPPSDAVVARAQSALDRQALKMGYVPGKSAPAQEPQMRRGGPLRKAMGGPLQPPAPVGPPVQPVSSVATPPGPAPGGPLSRATISMPAADAKNLLAGAVKLGAVAAQAAPLAARARGRIPPAQPMAGDVPMTQGVSSAPPQMGGVPAMRKGGHLTAADRHRLPASDFALPGERYPINNPAHARAALSRVSGNGTPAEKTEVRAAVHRKYPEMGRK
jgi:hypothetical protein